MMRNPMRQNRGKVGLARLPGFSTWGSIHCVTRDFPLTGHSRCGNGLLTHILVEEGYQGRGIDLRARTSWMHYPETTQSQLHVEALDPTELDDPALIASQPHIRPGIFIIGNHADELTPWVPVLATLCSASGYLSIPCCAWTFDMRYERSSNTVYPVPDGFVESLNLGGDGTNTSSYSS